MDCGLRWNDHIRELRNKVSKYMNILKWLAGRSWGIDPLQAINFINATIVAQCMWGSFWFINAAKGYLKQIESIISSSYKVALGLPRNSSNKVCWKFTNQPSFGTRVARACDKYLCKVSVLSKGEILNKSRFIWDQFYTGKISSKKVPFLVSRWHIVEPFFKYLYKSRIHPFHTFPFKEKFVQTEFDLISGSIARDSNDPDKAFDQLIKDSRKSLDEVVIFTDGSKTLAEDSNMDNNKVGCAIFIPLLDKSFSYKLNPLTSSFMAEVWAIDKVCHLIDSHSWQYINVCSDFLSVLTALKFAELEFFPKAINKLNTGLADLSYKISRINFNNSKLRFTWCPAHIGIMGNERADLLAKSASISGELWNNLICHGEISSVLSSLYRDIDYEFFFSESEVTGSYFLKNFCEINLNLIKKFIKSPADCMLLTRIVTGFPRTNSYLFKMKVTTSPGCCCGAELQNLNHIFWACPMLNYERRKLLILLRALKLFDPFSIEYLIGNLNKKIAVIMIRFARTANSKLDISL